MTTPTDDEVRALVERLQERLTLRYMGDCKCGKCQLVPGDLVCEAATMLTRLIAERAEARKVVAATDGWLYAVILFSIAAAFIIAAWKLIARMVSL